MFLVGILPKYCCETRTVTFAEHLAGSGLRDCFAFWLARRNGERPATKRDIDPTQLPRAIMPSLFLYELTADDRFRCRLAGSAIRQAFGKEPTGQFLDEIINSAGAANRVALFRATLERELPVIYGGSLAEGDKLWMPFKRLLLPVTDDRGSSRFVFGMVIFPRLDSLDRNERRGEELNLEFQVWATPVDLATETVIQR